MNFTDIISLAWRNLRQAKLRTALTVVGVIVGVAAIVTLVSFGIGLQRNILGQALSKLDVFTSITVRGASADALLELNEGRTVFDEPPPSPTPSPENPENNNQNSQNRLPRSVLNDQTVAEMQKLSGVKYVLPVINFTSYVKYDNRARRMNIGGAPAKVEDNPRFRKFLAGRAFTGDDAPEAIINEDFLQSFSAKWYEDRRAGRPRTDGPIRPTSTRTEAERAEDAKQVIGKEIVIMTPRSSDAPPTSIFGIPLLNPPTDEINSDPDFENNGRFEEHRFAIVGVLPSEGGININPFGNTRLTLPIEIAKRFRENNLDPMERLGETLAGDSGYPFAEVRVADPTHVKPVMDQIDKMGFRTFSITNQLDEINRIFLIINASLGLIGGIALLVASFGISNTMIMSIRERTREIGIMKAIGGSDSEIMRVFFIEAGLIGLAGGALGVIAGWLIDRVANVLANKYIIKNALYVEFFSIPWYLWGGAIAFAIVVSLLAAIYPALRAARVDPIKALRHE